MLKRWCHPRIAVVVALLHIQQSSAFNIDVTHPVIFQGISTDPSGRLSKGDTYFGYSVALSVSKNTGLPFLLVGAPKANSTLGLFLPAEIHEPGVLYKCPIRRGSRCEEILVDGTGNEDAPDFSYKDLKNGGWLGGSLDAEVSGEGRFSICSHRWRNQKYGGHYLGNGACYSSDNQIRDNDFQKIVPLTDRFQQFAAREGINVYMYSYGQVGTSVHLPDNGDELLMGAPGVFDWTGAIVRYKRGRFTDGSIVLQQQEPSVTIPSPDRTPGLLQRYDYFGYSISSGKFFKDSDNTFYLVGAPRAEGSKGTVFLLDFPSTNDGPYTVHAKRVGSSLGEYFGGAVLAIDLNGDGLCEMVIGAPLFSSESGHQDEGRVYVYMNQGSGIFREVARPLTGSGKSSSRFGSAISRLYDIDQDGFEDMAVGAPYEDEGRGVVYIYRGGAGDLDLVPSQRIPARDIENSLRGFGVSISRGVDIDGNRYPDVAIGSYASGDAVLLRTNPVIKFESSLIASPNRLDMSVKKFEVKACLSYNGSFVPDELMMNITVQIVSFHANSTFDLEGQMTKAANAVAKIQRGISACSPFKVAIRSEGLVDYTQPVQIVMNYHTINENGQIAQNQTTYIRTTDGKRAVRQRFRRQTIEARPSNQVDEFCQTCPTVNTHLAHQKSLSLNIPFSVGCGLDAVCQTDLLLLHEFPQLSSDVFIIGSRTTLDLRLRVRNLLEPASLPRLFVDMSSGIGLLRVPPSCQETITQESKTTLICTIQPHPFYNSSVYDLDLTFDMETVPNDVRSLKFNVTASSTGEEATPDNNIANITLTLLSEADIDIAGQPQREFITFETTRSGKRRQQIEYIQHSYHILKYLQSPVKSVNTTFLVPVDIVSDSGEVIRIITLHPPDAYINAQPFQCASVDGDYITSSHISSSDQDGRPDDTVVRSFGSEDLQFDAPSASSSLASALTQASSNSTLTLSCTTSSRVRCARITCQSISFLGQSDQATVTLGMNLNLKALRPLLDGIDRLQVFTEGFAEIVDNIAIRPEVNQRQDKTSVLTELVASTPESEPISVWIIIGAIVGALLLLAMITYGLHLGGFFERTKRDEMTKERLREENDDVTKEMFGSTFIVGSS